VPVNILAQIMSHIPPAPPSGRVGVAIASILGKTPGSRIDQALRRFRQRMETGEIARAA
jgi:uncharacterized membrane protein